MILCRECGLPKRYRRFFEWTRDGTLIGRDPGKTRAIIADVNEVQSLLSGVSDSIGLSIDNIVFRAEKEVGRRFMSALAPSFLPRIPRSRLTRPMWFGKLMSFLFSLHVAGLGAGHVIWWNYVPGQTITFRFLKPHILSMIAGDAAGVFEYLERVSFDAVIEGSSDGTVRVTLERVGEAPQAEERLVLEHQAILPGRVEYNRCSLCGAPKEVTANLEWRLSAGTIVNKITDAREAMFPAQSFYAVLRELEKELGEEIPTLIEKIAQTYARSHFAASLQHIDSENLLDLFMDFTWRGIGNPVLAELTNGGAEIVIENYFHPGLVAGKVAGIYEGWSNISVLAGWTEEAPGRLKVTLEADECSTDRGPLN